MYMLKSVVSVALFAAYAIAQSSGVAFTSTPSSVTAGSSYTITWTGGDATQPVTIILRNGDPNDLQTVTTLTTTATGGSFTWNVDPAIADSSQYAFEIQQGTDTNYSGQFAVSGGTGTLSFASASATGSLTASGSASATGSASTTASTTGSASASASASESSAAASSTTLSAAASKTSAATAKTSAPSSGASGLQSPIALILGAVAAMLSFA